MNNPSIIEQRELAHKELLEKLGLTREQIEKNKELITSVDEAKAAELGKELVLLIGKKGYDEEDEKTYQELLTLIKNGANLSFESSKGNFPLLLCAKKGYLKTFITLLKFGANIHQINKNKTSVAMSSARHGHNHILEIAILMGVDINALCFDADTALIMAKQHGMEECFKTLIDNNAILNIKNYLNLTSYDVKNVDGGANIDDSKYYAEVPKSPLSLTNHEDAMDLINEAKSKLAAIKEDAYLSSVTPEETLNDTEQTKSYINFNFKVK